MLSRLLLLSIALLSLSGCDDKAPLDTSTLDESDADTDSDTDADTDADSDTDTGDTAVPSSCPGGALALGELVPAAGAGIGDTAHVSLTPDSTGAVCEVVCADPWFEITIGAGEDCGSPPTWPATITEPSRLCLTLAVLPERDPAETTCTVLHSDGQTTELLLNL